MKVEKKQTYETYNHSILWSTAEKILNIAESSDDDTMFHSLGAMILFFFAFEGYLNWLGDRIAPEEWKKEKDFFSRPPYQGPMGKYQFLLKTLHLPMPDKSKRPYQTAKETMKLRNNAVHPKAEYGERIVKFAEKYTPPQYQSNLSERVSLGKANQVKIDLQKLAAELHQKAREICEEVDIGYSAFSSCSGYDLTDA